MYDIIKHQNTCAVFRFVFYSYYKAVAGTYHIQIFTHNIYFFFKFKGVELSQRDNI